ncbi:flagellar basal body-associated FliL family protein [Methylococcus sp. EFPC2]|uniref:flagellar basal body-associated FliL family protein n=1 Tax=Methylococcus sp. EFPC2 TaxID=2812648 RepID=UPI0019680E34|nr:flagellar basal body-associated FliL family protein [Methylococcus sp. EFPC2]QSA97643.1 flagellar basal body-associated FliL family protein [Methylococcus sp. EFPC2]
MAEKEKLDLGDEKTKKSSKGIILAVVGTIVLTLAVVAGTLYFLGIFPPKEHGSSERAQAGAEGSHEEAAKASHPLVYLPLTPPFTANFKGDPEVRLIQVEITVAATDKAVLDTVTKHSPMIRNNLLLLLSSQDPAVLKTAEGKETFRGQIKESIKKVVVEQSDKTTGVDEVFFTGFVMQ